MGWYYSNDATRGDIILEITKTNSTDEGSFKTLRKCFRGNTMYALHESGKHGELRKWIGVYLLQRGTSNSPGWGYKPMDETMEPYYYACPVSYLDEADEPVSEGAKKWRAKVRGLAAERKAKKPKKGEVWSLVGCSIPQVTLLSLKPLRGRCPNGVTYRIKRSLLGEIVA